MDLRKADILVVDDEPEICRLIADALNSDRRRCAVAGRGPDAYHLICRKRFDVLISDVAMPGMTGLELLDKVVAVQPECRVILMTGVGSSEWAKQAIRRGAFEYVEKPFDISDLRKLVDAALDSGDDSASRGTGSGGIGIARAVAHWDALTGLLNHRCFYEELAKLRARCRRSNHPLTVAMIDLDRFHEINVRYGHAMGDLILRETAGKLRSVVRGSDVLARFGGEEFAVAMPETTADRGRVLAERVRGTLRNWPVSTPGGQELLTVSIGLAESQSGFIESESELVDRSLEALQAAKRGGRDQIMEWEQMAEGAGGELKLDKSSLEQMTQQFAHIHQQLKQTYLEMTRALVAAVEAKEPYTERHSMAVALYAEGIARTLELGEEQIVSIRTAALLHDVGKIGIPDSILTKPGRLTEGEFALIKRHPVMAVQILEHVSFLRVELPIILHHHEWWDGSGYPEGLQEESIPMGARILHVADSMDAMFSVRSYKRSYGLDRVIAELRRSAGGQFDPAVVEAAVAWLERNPGQILVAGRATDQAAPNATTNSPA